MKRAIALLVVLAGLAVTAEAQNRYPRVYGATGRMYGPTQAHYQYQLQYGRQWSGYRGIPGGAEIGAVNGYPRVYGGYGGYYPVWPGYYGVPYYGYGYPVYGYYGTTPGVWYYGW